jgi:hypothetical protein
MMIPSFSCYTKEETPTVTSASESQQHSNQPKKSCNTNDTQTSKKPHVTTNSNHAKAKKKSETLNQLTHSTSQSLGKPKTIFRSFSLLPYEGILMNT